MMWDWGISEAVIREITEIAKRNQIQEIILFGSRARGDYNRTSDIDLAVTGGNISGFAVSIEEETSTLLEYDIVDLDKPVSEELLKSIRDEGKILYEKT
jgi:predicted nucleotidyltransferase